jgi:hypothetical protein
MLQQTKVKKLHLIENKIDDNLEKKDIPASAL